MTKTANFAAAILTLFFFSGSTTPASADGDQVRAFAASIACSKVPLDACTWLDTENYSNLSNAFKAELRQHFCGSGEIAGAKTQASTAGPNEYPNPDCTLALRRLGELPNPAPPAPTSPTPPATTDSTPPAPTGPAPEEIAPAKRPMDLATAQRLRQLMSNEDAYIETNLILTCKNDELDRSCRDNLGELDNLMKGVKELNSNPEYLAQLPPVEVTSLQKAFDYGWSKDGNQDKIGNWTSDGHWNFSPSATQAPAKDKPYVTAQDCDRIKSNIDSEVAKEPDQEPADLSFFEVECGPLNEAYSAAEKEWKQKISAALSSRIAAAEQEEKKDEEDGKVDVDDDAAAGADQNAAPANPGNASATPNDGQSSNELDNSQPKVLTASATALSDWNQGYVQGENQVEQAKAAEAQRQADEARAAQEKAAADARASQIATGGSSSVGGGSGLAGSAQCQAALKADPNDAAVTHYKETHPNDATGSLMVTMYLINSQLQIARNCHSSDPQLAQYINQLQTSYAQSQQACDAIHVGPCSPQKP